MTIWVVIPIKAPNACKQRLRGALSDDARLALVEMMLQAAVKAADAAYNVSKVLLLGPHDYSGVDRDRIEDCADGLNPSLAKAREAAEAAGVSRLIFVSADLPRVTPDDIEQLALIGPHSIGIAPDRHERGTNAISIPLPAGGDFQFGYGESSFAYHCAEVARIGLELTAIRTPGLALDIDEPSDLATLKD